MKNPKDRTNERKGLWAFLKKAWQCIWNSGGSIRNGSKPGRSAQDIRDEYSRKCPWKGDLF